MMPLNFRTLNAAITIQERIIGQSRRLQDTARPALLEDGLAHQKAVDADGCVATFGDGPHDQRPATSHITGGEHGEHARHVGRPVT